MAGSELIAIITRTKNRPQLLKRALLSVKNQSYQNYIHIIVNDGGDSQTIADAIQETKSNAKIHTINSNGHMGMATNEGIKAAIALVDKLGFLTILDDDD